MELICSKCKREKTIQDVFREALKKPQPVKEFRLMVKNMGFSRQLYHFYKTNWCIINNGVIKLKKGRKRNESNKIK